jgi:hypothetical protein
MKMELSILWVSSLSSYQLHGLVLDCFSFLDQKVNIKGGIISDAHGVPLEHASACPR